MIFSLTMVLIFEGPRKEKVYLTYDCRYKLFTDNRADFVRSQTSPKGCFAKKHPKSGHFGSRIPLKNIQKTGEFFYRHREPTEIFFNQQKKNSHFQASAFCQSFEFFWWIFSFDKCILRSKDALVKKAFCNNQKVACCPFLFARRGSNLTLTKPLFNPRQTFSAKKVSYSRRLHFDPEDRLWLI